MLRKSGTTLGLQVCQLVGLLAIAILLARVTGARGKGVFSLVVTIVSLLSLLLGMGLSSAAVYFIRSRAASSEQVLRSLLTTALITGVIGMLLLAGTYQTVHLSFLKDLQSAEWLGGILLVVPTLLTTALGAIVLGLNRPSQWALLNATQVLVALLIQAVLAFLGMLTPASALLAFAAGAWVSACLAYLLVRRAVPVRIGLDLALFRRMVGYGVRSFVANVFALLNYRLDFLIVAALKGVVAVGYYAVAVAVAEAIWYVANATSTVLFPQVAGSDRTEAARVTRTACRNVFAITLVAVVVLLLVSQPLVDTVFGGAMAPAGLPLRLLLPGILALSLDKVISSYFGGVGKPGYATFLAALSLVPTLLLDLVLVPRWGVSGAAVASTIAYVLGGVAAVFLFWRESGSSIAATLIFQAEDVARIRGLLRAGVGAVTAPRRRVERP